MRIVTAQELESWLASGKVLEKDARGPKVVALENGLFFKIFHTRRHPVLARLQPAAKRFALNAEQLQRLGVPAPEITEIFWFNKEKGLSACLYRPLLGMSIEQLYLQEPEEVTKELQSLAKFIQELHKAGIYFRSLHLGNIINLPNGQFGLIDVLDLQFKGRPLGRALVKRNFKHLRHYLERRKLSDFPLERLISLYHQNN